MAAREEDALTKIQKYKAMLSSKRNKGEEKAIRKPKKKRIRKENVEMGLETVLVVPGLAVAEEEILKKSQSDDSKEEKVDSKLTTAKVFSQGLKQSSELLVGELVEQKSTTTTTEDQETEEKEATSKLAKERSASDHKGFVDKPKKEKSKVLSSIRRKRKKSKKKLKDAEGKAKSIKNEGDIEECLEEKFSWKESLSEGDSSFVVSPEKEDESYIGLKSSEQKLEKNESVEEDNSEEGEGKEKLSRAEKFKRWASFTKQKKTGEYVVIGSEGIDEGSSKATNLNQNLELLEEEANEDDLNEDNSFGNKAEQEKNSLKEETVNNTENLEGSSVPEKERNELTEKNNFTISPDNVQRTRAASFGKVNFHGSLTASFHREKSGKKSEEKKVSNADKENCENERGVPDMAEETCSSKKEDSENVNEVKSEQAIKQKMANSIVEEGEQSIDGTTTGDTNTEVKPESDTRVNEEQPKKKKKGFLLKISSKNLKPNKKDEKTEEQGKVEINTPLLTKAESPTGSEEVSPKTAGESEDVEKQVKRKKNALNLKLPKALKRRKASEYKVIAGAEAEKEIEKDEMLTQESIEKTVEECFEESQCLKENSEVFQKVEEVLPRVEDGEDNEDENTKDSEMLTQESIEKTVEECFEESQCLKENSEVFQKVEEVLPRVEDGEDNEDENTKDSESVYSFCRALMNDVIKELIDRVHNLEQSAIEDEQPNEVNNDNNQAEEEPMISEKEKEMTKETLGSVVAELKSSEEEKPLVDEFKKEEECCEDLAYFVDEMVDKEEESGHFSIKEKEEDVPVEEGELREIKNQDITEETNSESTNLIQSQETLKHSNEIDENIQEHSEDAPNQSEDSPKPSEDESKPSEVQLQLDNLPKQPEDEPKQTEDAPKPSVDDSKPSEEMKLQPDDVSKQPEVDALNPSENESKPSEEVQLETDVMSKQPEDVPKQSEDVTDNMPKESDQILQPEQTEQISEQNENVSQPSEVLSERSEGILQSSEDKMMKSEGTSKPFDNEINVLERSIEVSMKTRALIDSYILVDHSLQLSQRFLSQVELMDLNLSNKRKSRCNIM